jgi:hypothetical protein
MNISSIGSRPLTLLAALLLVMLFTACGNRDSDSSLKEQLRFDSLSGRNHASIAFAQFLEQFPPATLPFTINGDEMHDTALQMSQPLDTPSMWQFITHDTSFSFRVFAPDSPATVQAIQQIVPIARVDISPSTVAVIYRSIGAAGGAEDNYRLMVWRTDGTFLASLPFAAFLSEGTAGLTAEGRLEKTTGGYRVTNRTWQWTGIDLATARRRDAGTREWTITSNGTVR